MKTYRQNIGEIVKGEKGKSQAKMGDAVTIVNAVFDKMIENPRFLSQGLAAALKRRKVVRR